MIINSLINRTNNLFNSQRGFLMLAGIVSLISVIVVAIVFQISVILAIALVLGLVIIGLTLQYPSGGLVILVFITWIRFSDVIVHVHNAPSVAQLFVPFLMGVIVLRWWMYKEAPTGWQRVAAVVSIYLFVASLSLLYTIEFRVTQYVIVDVSKDLLIALVAVFLLKDKATLRYVMWALIMAGIFLGTIAVMQYITNDYANNFWGFAQAPVKEITADAEDSYRIGGPIGDPNNFAQIMLLIVPIAFDRLNNEKSSLMKLLAGWGFIAIVLTIILTFSRGAFMALFGMFFIIFVLKPPKLSTILATILICVLLLPFVPSQFMERMSTLTNFLPGSDTHAFEDGSFRQRTSHFLVGLNMFTDYPVFGVGLGQFKHYYQTYSRPLGINTGNRGGNAAHNRWIEIAAEQGTLGLVVQFIVIGGMYINIKSAERDFREMKDNEFADLVIAFGIGFIGYLAAGTFLSDSYPRYFWLAVGIAYAIPNIAKYELAKFKEVTSSDATPPPQVIFTSAKK